MATLLAKLPPPKRCEYDETWSSDGIPDYVARAEFHIAVKAGLNPPSMTPDLITVLDPEHRKADSFCTKEVLKTYTAEKANAFEHSSDQSMAIQRTLFSFPIFNDSFSKAIVVVEGLSLDSRFRMNGKVGRHPTAAYASAEVYRKIGGRWRFVRSIELGIS